MTQFGRKVICIFATFGNSIALPNLNKTLQKSMVTYQLNGQNIVRTKAETINDANSLAQRKVRAINYALQNIYKQVGDAIAVGFPQRDRVHSTLNAIQAANKIGDHSCADIPATFNYAESHIHVNFNYAALQFSKGTLAMPEITGISSTNPSVITYTQAPNSNPMINLGSDKLHFVIHNLTTNKFATVLNVGTRNTNTDSVTLPSILETVSGNVINVYAFFTSSDNRKASNTVVRQGNFV